MLTVSLLVSDISAKEGVKIKVKELEARKKTDPTCKYLVTESPDGSEFIVDFLMGQSKDDRMELMEFNVYRYKQIKAGGRKALMLYSYTKRSYGDGITDFLKNLKEERMARLNEMIGAQLPEITLK